MEFPKQSLEISWTRWTPWTQSYTTRKSHVQWGDQGRKPNESTWTRNTFRFKPVPAPALCFGGHHSLRSNQLRRRMATADAQIIAEGGMSSIGCGHHLTRAITLNLAGRVAGRAGHAIAFVCDVSTAQLNRGWRSLDGPVSRRLVAIQNQISLHSASCHPNGDPGTSPA